MTARLIDRLWLVAGVLGAVIVLAIGWFFFISPINEEADSVRSQISVEEDRFRILQIRLGALKSQNDRKQEYVDELAADRLALPPQHELSRFLVELQTAGNATGTVVSSVTVGPAGSLAVAGADVRAIPITLQAAGQQPDVHKFLDQIQLTQPRAVLIRSVTVNPDGVNSQLGKTVTATIDLDIFVTLRK